MLKKCKTCGIKKSISDFYKGRKECKDCKNKAAREFRKNNPEKVAKYKERHNWYLKERRYGISKKEYENLLKLQNNKCAICLSEFNSTKNTHIDHCHNSSRIRGILCNGCNISLGQFEDNIEFMQNAIKYLKS